MAGPGLDLNHHHFYEPPVKLLSIKASLNKPTPMLVTNRTTTQHVHSCFSLPYSLVPFVQWLTIQCTIPSQTLTNRKHGYLHLFMSIFILEPQPNQRAGIQNQHIGYTFTSEKSWPPPPDQPISPTAAP